MVQDPLSDIPMFKALPEGERRALARLLKERQFAARQPVVLLGEPGDEFFLVRAGTLVASCPDETGREVTLGTLGPGHFFGEISLLDGGPRTATVRAQVDADLLALGRDDFLRFLREHPDAAIHMLTVLGQRQRETLEKVRGIRNVNDAVAQARTNWQRMAEKVAALSASRAFVLINLVGFALWIIINVALAHLKNPLVRPWDEAPTFSVLSFVVTVEALFITLFVLISQGQQGERDRIRADLDYQINLKAHQEVMQLHHKIDRVQNLLAARGLAGLVAPPATTPVPSLGDAPPIVDVALPDVVKPD